MTVDESTAANVRKAEPGAQPDRDAWRTIPPWRTGPAGRCPRCGIGHIFRGFLSIRDRCEICGLDFSYADPADGPAVFVQLFACVPGIIFLVILEIVASPPLWVHLATSLPILIVTTILPLRPIKGWLVASQFFFKAGQGRLVAKAPEDA